MFRPWLRSDAPEVVSAYADPAVHRWHCRSLSLAEAGARVSYEADRWELGTGASWAVTHSGSLQGRVGFSGIYLAEGRAGVTYWVLPAARGQGIAALALGAVAA